MITDQKWSKQVNMVQIGSKNDPKMIQKWSKNGPKMIQKRSKKCTKWSKKDTKMIQKWSKMWSLLVYHPCVNGQDANTDIPWDFDKIFFEMEAVTD